MQNISKFSKVFEFPANTVAPVMAPSGRTSLMKGTSQFDDKYILVILMVVNIMAAIKTQEYFSTLLSVISDVLPLVTFYGANSNAFTLQ